MSMFGKNKKELNEIRDKMNAMQPDRPEPSLIDTLRDRRTDKIKRANDLDREIAALDSEITWLERNPKAQDVLREITKGPRF